MIAQLLILYFFTIKTKEGSLQGTRERFARKAPTTQSPHERRSPDWQFVSFERGGKDVWTCQLVIDNHICGTEYRNWDSHSEAKVATALVALAFLKVGSSTLHRLEGSIC